MGDLSYEKNRSLLRLENIAGYTQEKEPFVNVCQTKITRQRTHSSLFSIRNAHCSRNKLYNNRNIHHPKTTL